MNEMKLIKLEESFRTINNWKDLYQWPKVISKSYTEKISEWLIDGFDGIKWDSNGLSKSGFKQETHKGDAGITGKSGKFTEKRFCYALYNKYCETPHSLLGKIIDYEVPLTERGQKEKITHGDIDLLAERKNELLFIEVKKSGSVESLLKAILEIFVYVNRLSMFKLLEQFLIEYKKQNVKFIIPCILTFKNSTSGDQLGKIKEYPYLIKLINRMNRVLESNNICKMQFYLIENDVVDLNMNEINEIKKQYKITLKREVHISQVLIP